MITSAGSTVTVSVVEREQVMGMALLEFPDLLAHQFPVDGVGMVEVDVLAFLHGNVAGILVVGILGDDDHPALQLAGDSLDDRGLA